jgi:serine/threonine-protein kinase
MATIFKGVDEQMMDRIVAVKILREVYSNDPKFVTRFQREARAASALQHPNIVQVFDYGQSAESYYIVMEYIDGMDLRRYLKRRGNILPVERAVEIARAVAMGLGAAHRRGIVHRDVKPQNIMVNDDGLVKLTDFGIASMYKDADAERLTTTGMTLGTVQYYAPEQAQGEIVRPSADIYALGIVMYEMLAGQTPFDGDTPVAVAMKHIQEEPEPPSAFNPRIPPALERIILKCLSKDPNARYRDGDELASTLTNFMRSPGRRTGASGPTEAAGMYGAGAARSGGPASGPRPNVYGPPNGGQFGGVPDYGAAGGMGGGGGRGSMSPTGRPAAYNAPYGGGMGDEPTYDGPPSYDARNPYGGGGPVAAPTRPWETPGTQPRLRTYGDEPPRRNVGLIAAIVGASAVVLLVGCFLLVTLTGNLPGFGSSSTTNLATVPPSRSVLMPNYATDPGKTWTCTDAKADALAKYGLKATCVPKQNSAPINTVIDQSPPAGSALHSGDSIQLTSSSGQANLIVPNVIGQQYTDASNELTSRGFSVSLVTDYSDKYTAGQVISTNPSANTSVSPSNNSITVTVSKGPQPTATAAATATSAAQPTATKTATPVPTATCGLGTPTPC